MLLEKDLLQASERRASSKLQSTLSNDSDSESEDNAAKQAKTVPKLKKKSQNYSEENQVKTWRDEFDDGLDSDLVGDEDDRDNLNDMTEKQREEELFKRAERREELKKRFEISQKLKLQQKNKEKSGNQSMNSDSEDVDKDQMSTGTGYHQASTDYQGRRKGYEEKYANKFSALNNLKAQREEKEKKELERKEKEKKFKRKHGGGSGSGSGSDLEKIGGSSKNKKMLKASGCVPKDILKHSVRTNCYSFQTSTQVPALTERKRCGGRAPAPARVLHRVCRASRPVSRTLRGTSRTRW